MDGQPKEDECETCSSPAEGPPSYQEERSGYGEA